MNAEKRLQDLKIHLPSAPKPAGNYVPYVVTGNLIFLAGTICMIEGKMSHTGATGEAHTVNSAYEAARVCALNSLALLKEAAGDLDRIKRIVSVSGFVNAVPGFTESPQVINGASDLFADVFGEAGKHARAAVAVGGLPLNSTVEIQVVAELDE
ncbi:RidA family protein [Rubellicoccus peritrichatus]|uniref:RidA family protein n=1 Tax=Rubellicoccus peritrichatus TaxID=3080537 RepID=A0AAQ3QT56_9BACT|nr:RidA family protein [Puniceicoccus sp. CR14]WOO43328.1 RidA family protein [Puniceicoccus sp. CR14]